MSLRRSSRRAPEFGCLAFAFPQAQHEHPLSLIVFRFFTNVREVIKRVHFLARPYGRKKLAFVFGVILAQGLFQVVGVVSILPFLGMAASPNTFRNAAAPVLEHLPVMTDKQLLMAGGILAFVMLLISNGLLMMGEVVRTRYAQGFGHWLRVRLLRRIVSNNYGYFISRNTGELLKKVTGDVMMYISGVLAPLLDGFARLVTVVLLLGLLVVADPFLATVAGLVLGGFYVVVFWALRNRLTGISEQMKEANRGSMREAQQLLGGIKPVLIHGMEEAFVNRYAAHSQVQGRLTMWLPIIYNSPRYLVEVMAFGGIVLLVVVLAARGEDRAQYIPTLSVMAFAGYRLLPNLQLLYGQMSNASVMRHSLEEVYDEFMEVEGQPPRDLGTPITEVKPLSWQDEIHIDHVTFQYPTAPRPLFEGLDLRIKKNSFVAFVGKTGSGKSTIVDLILGLHRPSAGALRVDGEALTDANIPNWRAGIGYVPQEIFLLDGTIASNIAFGLDEDAIDQEKIRKAARTAQIADFIENELDDGYQTQVGERGVRLSGGQRQRIGLARALYHEPELLVLDEATSALDNATEAALMEAIEQLQGTITLIVIAHRLTTVERSDTVFVLEKGQLIKQGTYADISDTADQAFSKDAGEE